MKEPDPENPYRGINLTVLEKRFSENRDLDLVTIADDVMANAVIYAVNDTMPSDHRTWDDEMQITEGSDWSGRCLPVDRHMYPGF